ncbi:hypothetical protein PHLCEN_2v6963 [Hermanssonia centrifuga]|uniref:EXS domain-containing protein n=1 Tax=Hermanssonia centrifuga TaxID=98765 RepID=A0A2R6NYP4_9APHY|nr:hypothetical protein PHLCEN_2v6963 [Hermanssonia centrifuga]
MSDNAGDEITFSANFPLPFRVLALGALGILGWATNLHGLNLLGLEAANALELSTHQAHRLTSSSVPNTPLPTARAGWKVIPHPSTIYGPVYKLFFQYSAVCLVGWALYRHATRGEFELVDIFKFVPAVTTLCLFMILVSPFNFAEKRERDKFLQ